MIEIHDADTDCKCPVSFPHLLVTTSGVTIRHGKPVKKEPNRFILCATCRHVVAPHPSCDCLSGCHDADWTGQTSSPQSHRVVDSDMSQTTRPGGTNVT